MSDQRITFTELNTLGPDMLEERLGHLFEHSPWIVRDALPGRPFASREAFHSALCAVVRNASPDAQVTLIREHPDLVGRAALAGTLTPSSTSEQAGAGLGADSLSQDERDEFQRLNKEYRDRFGFPFVICARENRKASILAGFQQRLRNERAAEIATAIAEIEKIAWYRLIDSVRGEGGQA